MSDPVTRAEFEALSRQVERNANMGTAQAGLAVQVAEVIKDMTELRAELRDHRIEHQEEAQLRAANRRWAVSLGVAALAAIGGLYPVLLTLHR